MNAVFLSYASQDADAARRICEALPAAGVEVWFDQSELRGGDAWDQKIRKQIKDCALFVPVISANTQARREGYFRIEWKLAAQRTHAIADGTPFLVPVVIDGTREADALTPEEFRAVQWTLLRDEAPSLNEAKLTGLVGRVGQLLDRSETVAGSDLTPGIDPRRVSSAGLRKRSEAIQTWVVVAGVVLLAVGASYWFTRISRPGQVSSVTALPTPRASAAPSTKSVAVPVSEARQLARKAQEIIGIGEEVDLRAAELLTDRAMKLDSTDAEVWAAASSVDSAYLNTASGRTDERVRNAQERARTALSLDADLFEGRRAWAHFLVKALVGSRVASATEAVPILQKLRSERPRDERTLLLLGQALLILRRVEEAKEVHASLDAVLGSEGSGAWHYYQNNFPGEADAALDKSIASKPLVADVGLKIYLAATLHGDLDMGAAALTRLTEA
jgi:hypothetical protein